MQRLISPKESILPLFILLFLFLQSKDSTSQTREIYGGINFSNHYWLNNPSIQNHPEYLKGFQIGFIKGNKEKNLLGKRKILQSHLAFEYNYLRTPFNTAFDEVENQQTLDVHQLRLSVPVHVRFSKSPEERLEFYAIAEPGLNLAAFQYPSSNLSQKDKLGTFDFFVNGGAGFILRPSPKEYDESGYKFSGITFSATKYIPIHPFQRTSEQIGLIDQYRLNAGIHFSYVKVKKKKFFKLFK